MRNLLATGLFHLVKPLEVSSEMLSQQWPEPVSLLWIDGDDRYEAVLRDVNHWRCNLAPGAVLIFHHASAPEDPRRRVAVELVEGGEFAWVEAVGSAVVLRKQV